MPMFNYSPANSAYNYMLRRKKSTNLLIEAAKTGTNLLSKQIDGRLLVAFQGYVVSALNLASNEDGRNYLYLYNQFNLSIFSLSPYDQVVKTIEFLLDLARKS